MTDIKSARILLCLLVCSTTLIGIGLGWWLV